MLSTTSRRHSVRPIDPFAKRRDEVGKVRIIGANMRFQGTATYIASDELKTAVNAAVAL